MVRESERKESAARVFCATGPRHLPAMSRLESKKHSPAQVFAQFTSSGENEGPNGAKTECKHEGVCDNRREIQITESGEASLPPDKARVYIVCSNAKVSYYGFICLPFKLSLEN